jgi:hypothetical protein
MAKDLETKTQRSWLTEGILLALLPVVSYAIAFTYEVGYFEHFGLPFSLVQIGITGSIIAFFSLLMSIFILYMLAELLNPLWGIIPHPVRGRARTYAFFLFLIIINLVIAHGRLKGLQYLLYFVAIIAFIDFVIPLISRKDGKSYLERFDSMRKRDLAYDSVMDKFVYKFGLNWLLLLLVVGSLLYLSYNTGLGKARSQTEFFTLQGHPNSVVLRISDVMLIWTTYNEKTNEISRSFILERLEGDKKFILEKIKVGPLLPASVIIDTKGTKQNGGS